MAHRSSIGAPPSARGVTEHWTIMEAPTGHRRPLADRQGDDFPCDAPIRGGPGLAEETTR